MTEQRGAALVIVMMLTGLVAAAGLGVVAATATDAAVAGAFVWGWQAQYAAEAGIHRAIADLRRLPDWTAVLNGSVTSSFAEGPVDGPRPIVGGRLIDIRRLQNLATCERVAPCTDADRSAITDDRPWGANNPRWRPFAYGSLSTLTASAGIAPSAPAFTIVLAGDDPVETDGDPDRDGDEGGPGGGVIRLRAYGFGYGGARRSVEVVVARAAGGARVRVLQWRAD